ncbi:MAG: RNA methyltransferase [Bacteroidales bacterium]
MKEIINFLKEFMLAPRWELFNKIVDQRTRYLTIVLEDIYQSQNASAVLRTCDCFGVQDVHIIENTNQFRVNPDVVLGATKWLNLFQYNQQSNNTLAAINKLKEQGYRIVATTPHTNDVELDQFDLSKGKFALFFGSELPGLSNLVLENADEFLKIPMFGFTESFNISVSASIIMHHLVFKLKASDIKWQLSEDERDLILYNWLKTSINDSDKIEKEYFRRKISA